MSSCFGYDVKGSDDLIEQFKEEHFLKFGEHLFHSMAQHLGCQLNELDYANMTHGFDIELDFALYMKDSLEGQ